MLRRWWTSTVNGLVLDCGLSPSTPSPTRHSFSRRGQWALSHLCHNLGTRAGRCAHLAIQLDLHLGLFSSHRPASSAACRDIRYHLFRFFTALSTATSVLPVKRLAVIGFELAVSKKSTGSAGKASRAGRPPGRDRRRAGPPPKSGARAGGLQPTGEFERGDRQNTPISLGRHRPSTSITAVLKSAKSLYLVAALSARQFPDVLTQSLTYAPAAVVLLGAGSYHYLTQRAEPLQLLYATGVFITALTCRAVDTLICPYVALGTHFLWHLFNAARGGPHPSDRCLSQLRWNPGS